MKISSSLSFNQVITHVRRTVQGRKFPRNQSKTHDGVLFAIDNLESTRKNVYYIDICTLVAKTMSLIQSNRVNYDFNVDTLIKRELIFFLSFVKCQ